jgi:WhiB family redox-sensing transcriptional regulator
MTNVHFLDTWRDHAACTDSSPELFFPDKGDGQIAGHAKKICAGCPSRLPCLEYALAAEEWFGVWGGTTSGERRVIVRQRRARARREAAGEGAA